MNTVAITRKELYRQLWAEATTHVARRYGLSDVGMAKLCRKHDIPRPSRGYWAKKRFGKTPPQIPLPNPDSDYEIALRDPNDCQISSLQLKQEVRQQAVLEKQKEAKIKVADNLRGSHQLVSRARQELSTADADENRLIIPPTDAALNIRVTKTNLRRALLIMDALIKALEERDMPVSPGPEVAIQDVRLSFGINESLRTQREQPADHDLDGPYRFGHSRFHTKQAPNGQLVLRIDEAAHSWASGCRQSWRDGKKQRLENCLNKVIAGLVELAGRRMEHEQQMEREAEERRIEEARRQEERRLRAGKLERIKAERAQLDSLLKNADDWRRSQNLRDFIDAVRQGCLSQHGRINPDSELDQWIEWAERQADRIDPLVESPPSILDEQVEEEPRRRTW